MSLPSFKPSQRRLLVGSAIALALFATPFSYDFDHHQWQPNQAHAKSCFVAGTRILMERFINNLSEGHSPRMVEMPSNEAIKQAVLAGLGIAFLSLHTVQDEVKSGRLALLRGADLPIMRHWYLVPGSPDALEVSMATKRCAEEIVALDGVYFPKISA